MPYKDDDNSGDADGENISLQMEPDVMGVEKTVSFPIMMNDSTVRWNSLEHYYSKVVKCSGSWSKGSWT